MTTPRDHRWGYHIGLNAMLPGARSTKIDAVTVHFGDVTARAEEFISSSEQVIGAVAWVRSPRLVSALQRRPVSLIVNKEFALRRDGKERQALNRLTRPAGGFEATARVIGDCSRGAFTGLMHHKFLVRLSHGIPAAVWTGSLNFTSGAAGNFENAVEISDPGVAMMFYDEFCRLWGISEPLDFRQGRPTPARTVIVQGGRSSRKKTTTSAAPAKGRRTAAEKPRAAGGRKVKKAA